MQKHSRADKWRRLQKVSAVMIRSITARTTHAIPYGMICTKAIQSRVPRMVQRVLVGHAHEMLSALGQALRTRIQRMESLTSHIPPHLRSMLLNPLPRYHHWTKQGCVHCRSSRTSLCGMTFNASSMTTSLGTCANAEIATVPESPTVTYPVSTTQAAAVATTSETE